MRGVVLFLTLAGLALVHAAEVVEEDDVLVLTQENFKQVTDENNYVLVEFYAPWCGHCKALAPEYANAAGQLKEEGSPIKLGKVDATEESELAQTYGVRGYPTIKFFKNGKDSDYSAGRTAKDIVTWLKKRTGPPAEALETVDAAKAFTEKEDVVVVGFFEDETSDKATAYTNAADTQDTIYFGIVTSKEVAESLDATMDSIVVFKKFDDGRATFDGEFTVENIVTFVLGEQLPLVAKFSDETAPKIFGGEMKTHLLSFFEGDNEEYLAGLKEIAKDYRGKILFVQIDTTDDSTSRVTEFFGIEEDDLPTCRLINLDGDMKKFVPDFKGMDFDGIRKFASNYLEGTLKVHLNTEDVPEDWNTEPVKVLVGKNFDEVAMDPTKHVFVEFYAPWCGHCKQLAPIWEELAEHFAEDEDVVIAKMDSTKNEVESVQVQAFPTLKFIPKDSTEVLDYSGGRTLEDLIKYVEKKVSGIMDDDEDEDDDNDDDEEEDGDSDAADTDSDGEEEPEVPKDEL